VTANAFDPTAAAAMPAEDFDTDNTVNREVTDAEAAQVHSGHARMAYRMAVLHKGKLLHVHSIGWYYWDGQRWAIDEKGRSTQAMLDTIRQAFNESVGMEETAKKILRQDAHKSESGGGLEGTLRIASKLPAFAATVDDLDADPYLLNCANGTLDLRTLELRPHDPADRITRVTRAAYDPDATGPVWDKFINRVLPNEPVRGFLQRYVGQSLCGMVLEEKLAILTGIGRNGKGKFYGATLNALGDYASTGEPDLFMQAQSKHPAGQMDLLGRRFVVVSESDKDRNLAEATVKKLTGGDKIKAHYMHKDWVEFDPSHSAVLVTNHLPKVSGDDPALWERLRVVPFDVWIPPEERDAHLGEKLELEANAILSWIVQGWTAYEQGGLAEPEEVTEATDAYQLDSDTVARFVSEQCHKAPGLSESFAELFKRLEEFCLEEGCPPIAKKPFGQALDRKGFALKRSTGGARRRIGLKLLEED
jgi:putative DNA primase/helicase